MKIAEFIVGWLPPIMCFAGGWWVLETIKACFGTGASMFAAAFIFFACGSALFLLNRSTDGDDQ